MEEALFLAGQKQTIKQRMDAIPLQTGGDKRRP